MQAVISSLLQKPTINSNPGVKMESKNHWESVYTTKSANEVSWFQEQAEVSLNLISKTNVPASGSIIDVGGGASTLVDGLIERGYGSVTVLDLSGAAISTARSRLGERAACVRWVEANILEADLPAQTYDIWHDRAVFHFLTTPSDRRSYVRKAACALKPGGSVIIATFAEDGPTKCSGLPVMRYTANQLHAEFGETFQLVDFEKDVHLTPGGSQQRFVYCHFRKRVI